MNRPQHLLADEIHKMSARDQMHGLVLTSLQFLKCVFDILDISSYAEKESINKSLLILKMSDTAFSN